MDMHPPKWADRFLTWYCNPDLLEEIQGDAHELYFERVKNEGKTSADRKYILDVIRFCRWSNIKRSDAGYKPGYFGVLWNLNFKIALRNAFRHKILFTIKMAGLSVCLAFGLLLSAFIIHEFTFDQYHADHERIFRVGSKVGIQRVVTNYAVSPVALGEALSDEIPEIENSFTLMYDGKPAFMVGDQIFNNETAFVASNNFLKTLTFEFIQGTRDALDEPNKIVLTESTAKKFFTDRDPMGQTIILNETQLEVAAIIKDIPSNSHLKFGALISWHTFNFNEGWDNVNAYTYIKLKSGTDIRDVRPKILSVIQDHREEIDGGREHRSGDDITIEPIVEKMTEIHLSENLDEDIATKRNKSNLIILAGVVILFIITGLINYLNLSLAELAINIRKIVILRIFGGSTAGHGKIIVTNTLLSIFIMLPLTAMLGYTGLMLMESYFLIHIDRLIFISPQFMMTVTGFLLLFVFSSRINSFVLSRSNDIITSLKGKLNSKQNGFKMREFLVATQLSFSIIMIALIIIIVDQFDFINSADKGFEDRNTIVIKMRSGNFSAVEAFEESVRKLNGVKKVDGSSFYLDNVETKEFFEIESEAGTKKMLVAYMNCGYEYLDVLGIKLNNGRNFARDHLMDDKGAYIINETAAKEFGWSEPIGKKMHGPLGTDRDEGEIIGVVKDFHFASLHSKIEPLIIFLVNEDWGISYVYVKVNPIRPGNLIAKISQEYNRSFIDVPFEWDYLDSKYASLYKEDYEIRNVFRAGLVISILVSCLGIFSISALLVITREEEMGIRKVVGATQLQLFALHLKSFIKFMIISVLIAWPLIYYSSNHWLNNFAYHIGLNVWYFIFPAIVTLLIIVATAGYHGIKNSRVNPVNILKHE